MVCGVSHVRHCRIICHVIVVCALRDFYIGLSALEMFMMMMMIIITTYVLCRLVMRMYDFGKVSVYHDNVYLFFFFSLKANFSIICFVGTTENNLKTFFFF